MKRFSYIQNETTINRQNKSGVEIMYLFQCRKRERKVSPKKNRTNYGKTTINNVFHGMWPSSINRVRAEQHKKKKRYVPMQINHMFYMFLLGHRNKSKHNVKIVFYFIFLFFSILNCSFSFCLLFNVQTHDDFWMFHIYFICVFFVLSRSVSVSFANILVLKRKKKKKTKKRNANNNLSK